MSPLFGVEAGLTFHAVTKSNPPLEGERKRAWLDNLLFGALVVIAVGIGIVASSAGSVTQLVTGIVVISGGLIGGAWVLRNRRSVAQVSLRRDMFRKPRP